MMVAIQKPLGHCSKTERLGNGEVGGRQWDCSAFGRIRAQSLGEMGKNTKL